jgi:hypothetical protein
MIQLQWETTASPEGDAVSPAGYAVSPEGDLLASPNFGYATLLVTMANILAGRKKHPPED